MEHLDLIFIIDCINDKLSNYEWSLIFYNINSSKVKNYLAKINGFIEGIKIGFDIDIVVKYEIDGTIKNYSISKNDKLLYFFSK